MAEAGTGWTGRTLAARYAVIRRIGAGGFSTVYESLDTQLGRKVAIKLFSPGEARDDSRRRGEVDVLARLNHPNLVTMYDAHLAGGDSAVPSFLVMELVEGLDLRSALDHAPAAARLTGELIAQITSDIAEGLSAMHAIGIVHRDLKPANILLAPTGLPSPSHRAKLADFGIAYLVGADRMTTIGTVIGTAAYLSPEQASGAKPGPATDVYALGLVILECLTGRREYPGTIVESLSARAFRDPVVGEGIPASWITLLTQMTARDPGARPNALDVAVRARAAAPDLAAWQRIAPSGAGDEVTSASTVAMVAPTLRMPRDTAFMGASAVSSTAVTRTSTEGVVPTERIVSAERVGDHPPANAAPAQGKRLKPLVAAAVVVLLGGAIWAGTSLASSNSVPSSDPAQSGAPVPTETPAPTTVSTPADTPAPITDSTVGNSGNGNSGNGNGKNGKGKGKG